MLAFRHPLQLTKSQKTLSITAQGFFHSFPSYENRSKNILSFEIYHLSSSFEKLVTAFR